MMSPGPTAYPEAPEIPNPYLPSGTPAPVPQQPAAPGGQIPFFPPVGVFPSDQLVRPAAQTAAAVFTEEAKALGAIQIVTGVMHVGFGIVLGLLSFSAFSYWGFVSISFVGGYPFWGGLCFIISGSLSVSASKEFSSCLLKGSLGMNILSAIFSAVGVTLLLVDLIINQYPEQKYWVLVSGKGISVMLMLFSLLELGIACATAHLARRTISNSNTPILVLPNVYATSIPVQEPSQVPPRNNGYPAYAPTY